MSKLTIRNLTVGNWITAIAGCVVIISFFLPWWTTFILGAIPISTQSGLRIVLGGTSNASGLPLQVFLATPVAALLCLLLCGVYVVQGENTHKFVPIAQIALAVVGLLPFFLLPIEFGHWTVGVAIHFGFWTTILGMIGMFIGAVWSLIEIGR